MPPPTITIRHGALGALRRHPWSKRGKETPASTSMKSSSELSDRARAYTRPRVDSHRSRFHVEVVQNLDVIGEKADGGKHDATVSASLHGVERGGDVRAQPRGSPHRLRPNLGSERRPRSERCAWVPCYRRARRWLPRRRELHARKGSPASMTDRGKLCAVMTTVVGSGLGSDPTASSTRSAKARLSAAALPPVRGSRQARRAPLQPPNEPRRHRQPPNAAPKGTSATRSTPIVASFWSTSRTYGFQRRPAHSTGTPSRFASLRATAALMALSGEPPTAS
jgi:hypothetical protein